MTSGSKKEGRKKVKEGERERGRDRQERSGWRIAGVFAAAAAALCCAAER